MWCDLWALYRVDADVWLASTRPVERLYQLVERLSSEPASQYRAEVAGDTALRGWDVNTYILASIADATVWAAQTGAMNKVKFKETIERPHIKLQTARPQAVADVDWGSALAALMGGT